MKMSEQLSEVGGGEAELLLHLQKMQLIVHPVVLPCR